MKLSSRAGSATRVIAQPAISIVKLLNSALRNPGMVPACATRVVRTVITRALDGVITIVAFMTKKRPKHSLAIQGNWARQPSKMTVYSAQVTGAVPSDLRGMFLTICPNPEFLPTGGYHPFDGDGSLVAVRIHPDGRASFSFHRLLTQKVMAERRIGYSRVLSFAALSGRSGFLLVLLGGLRRFMEPDKYSPSTANTNIEQHAGRVFALWEGAIPYELRLSADGTTFECGQQIAIDDQYSGPFSAHPVVHPTSGKLYAVSYTLEEKHDAVVVVLDKEMKFERSIPIHLGRKPMIHDAAITKKYVVILDFPFLFEPKELMQRNGKVFSFHPEQRSRIGLMPVNSTDESEITWFESDPCFCFHVLSAWDTESGIVLYLCQMDNFDIQQPFDYASLDKLVRYDIDAVKKTCKVTEEPVELSGLLNGYGFDLPFVNKQTAGGPAQFAYMTVYLDGGDGYNAGLVKYNLSTRTVEAFLRHRIDGQISPGIGEAAFVPKENQEAEDDGYILIFVRDAQNNARLHVYDARTMNAEPLCVVHAPPGYHIPNGFHSEFVTEDVLTVLSDSS